MPAGSEKRLHSQVLWWYVWTLQTSKSVNLPRSKIFRRKERLFKIVGKELFPSILITDHILYFPLIFEKNHRLFHPIPEKTYALVISHGSHGPLSSTIYIDLPSCKLPVRCGLSPPFVNQENLENSWDLPHLCRRWHVSPGFPLVN